MIFVKVGDARQRRCLYTHRLPLIKRKRAHKNHICCGAWSGDGHLLAFKYTPDSDELLELQQVLHILRRSRRAPVEPVSCLRFDPTDAILGCTHVNSKLYLFDVIDKDGTVEPRQHATMDHIAAPVQLQLLARGEHDVVKTFTRDYEVVHWLLRRDKRDCAVCPWIPDPDEVEWHGDPLIAGWDVKGLYRTGHQWDGTDHAVP